MSEVLACVPLIILLVSLGIILVFDAFLSYYVSAFKKLKEAHVWDRRVNKNMPAEFLKDAERIVMFLHRYRRILVVYHPLVALDVAKAKELITQLRITKEELNGH